MAFDTNVVSPILSQAFDEFFAKNRDLVACVRGGRKEIFHRIQAEMMLDDAAEEAVTDKYRELTSEDSEVVGSALSHPNLVTRDVARGFMKIEFYRQICLSFLRLTADGTLTYAIKLTDEAEEQKYQIGVAAGCIAPQAAIRRQAQAQTAAESLDQEIAADWNGRLTTTQIQAKKKLSAQYGARLNAMLNEGKLS